jgi:hypothetical protein
VDYSLFIDGFSILHSMDYGIVAYDTALSLEHAVSRASYFNSSQARVATSYCTAYLDVFRSSDDKGRSFDKSMSAYSKWHDRDSRGGLFREGGEGSTLSHCLINQSRATGLGRT